MPRLQITITGTNARPGATWAVTQQWAVSSGPANALALQTVLTTAFNSLSSSSPFKSGVSLNYSVTKLHGLYYPVPGGTASIVADSGGAAFAGTFTSGPIPLAVVVSERTNAAGASYRGRSYWPAALANADGTITASTQSLVQNSWTAAHSLVLAALSGAGWSPVHVVWSPKTGNLTPISYTQVGNRIDTARGRFGDGPETYVATALPSSAQFTPAELGLPDSTDPYNDPVVQAILNSGYGGSATLGPLGQLAEDALTTISIGAAGGAALEDQAQDDPAAPGPDQETGE